MLNTISKYFNKNLFYDLKILNDFINDINYFNHIYLYIYISFLNSNTNAYKIIYQN